MNEWMAISILYAIGVLLLLAEFFLPAHGIIGVGGVIMLAFGLYETYQLNETAGMICTIILLIMLPVSLVVAVKTWHYTPMGKLISPPNPIIDEDDRVPVEEYKMHIGQKGLAKTVLRPVGTCEFNGKRISCVAEYGMIEPGQEVEAVGIKNRTLTVRPVDSVGTPDGDSSATA